jgi:diacylglycerol kinase family enzyme
MYLLLNKYAGGGSAEKKWKQIKNSIIQRFDNIHVIDLQNHLELENVIKEGIEKGDKDFIMAGGDGTINLFLNRIINFVDEKKIKLFRIGAIGIGSSNDFHKPLQKNSIISGFPTKINFKDSQLRDVGVIRYKSDEKFLKKYFLINASIGITAEANNFFNKPDFILKFLKRHFTPLAILYPALKKIFAYKNLESQIIYDSSETHSYSVSNLSIIKNPNFSGNLSYPCEADYQNGLFDIYLAHSMNKNNLISLLISLGKKIFPKNEKTKHSITSNITISSKSNFLIEFDGEIIATNYAEFSILKEYLNICTN